MNTNHISVISKLAKIIAGQTLVIIALLILLVWLFAFRADTHAPQATAPPAKDVEEIQLSENALAGEKLYKANCASCHALDRRLTGPPLIGAEAKAPSKELLYQWVKNSAAVLKDGEAYYTALYNKYNQTTMTSMPHLEDEDIANIFTYVSEMEDQKGK